MMLVLHIVSHQETHNVRRNQIIAALFTIARTWKQPKCPSTDEWIKKMWHIYTMEYYSAITRNEIELLVVRWMDLETVIQSEDFKLDFGNPQGKTSETWHGGIATIFESPGDEVWGVVWKMNKSNLSSLDKQEGVKSGMYVPIEVNASTQEGKEITCRSYQMTNYERAPPSPQYKKVICLGAKENGLPLEYQKKLNAIEPNDYKGKVSEEIEDIIKKGEAKTH
ncbi:gamma-glutamylcyclotransferase isoform X3 [Balaenoptera acutorostrata]|uniref:gamma-glutamylcyclotransferase n=1 Tax=Balaenoptera acutorostrata TaxID=9767 RepID=A0ABM3TU45_BALAC|nr:gamma-glutamylcyclotransferase isoform X3 [Balaenoptera acutorostrata]